MNKSQYNITDRLCLETKLILTKPLFIIQILQCIFAPAAIVLNILMLCLLWRVKVFHINLRLLLANLSFDLACFPATMAAQALIFFFTPPCQLQMNLGDCVFADWLVQLPLHNSLMSLTALCLERLYVTIRYRTYDSAKARPYLACALLVASWIGTLYFNVRSLFSIDPNTVIPLCEIALYMKGSPYLPIAFVFLESVSCGMSVFVYAYNRYIHDRMVINRAKFDLGSRFQVSQNLKLSAALLPSDLLHVISYLPSYSSIIFAVLHFALAPPARMWFIHLTYLYRIIYASAHPLLLIKRNPNVRQAFSDLSLARLMRRCCGRSAKTADMRTRAASEMQTHFGHLEKMWDDELDRRRKKH